MGLELESGLGRMQLLSLTPNTPELSEYFWDLWKRVFRIMWGKEPLA
jgi:hypothetical protein